MESEWCVRDILLVLFSQLIYLENFVLIIFLSSLEEAIDDFIMKLLLEANVWAVVELL